MLLDQTHGVDGVKAVVQDQPAAQEESTVHDDIAVRMSSWQGRVTDIVALSSVQIAGERAVQHDRLLWVTSRP